MPLINTAAMLQHARKNHYAVVGFEPYSIDQIQLVIEAASEESAPVILQLWSEVIVSWGFKLLVSAIRSLAEEVPIPVSIHLDHATDINLIQGALDHGFTSVMYDGSALPFKDNVEMTRRVVKMARPYGASVEAELGIIGFIGDFKNVDEARIEIARHLTDAATAVQFVQETGIDILAPAVGSIHGCSMPLALVDVPRIREIAEAIGIPLALHGGSGVPEDTVKQAVEAGITKLNIDAEIRAVYIRALRKAVDEIGKGERDTIDLARCPCKIREDVKPAVKAIFRLVGSNGKAPPLIK